MCSSTRDTPQSADVGRRLLPLLVDVVAGFAVVVGDALGGSDVVVVVGFTVVVVVGFTVVVVVVGSSSLSQQTFGS
jgi:hypothetical protein